MKGQSFLSRFALLFLSLSFLYQAEVSFIQVSLLSVTKSSQRKLKKWLRTMVSRRPRFNSQHPHDISQLSVPGNSRAGRHPILASVDFKHTCGTQTCIQSKHSLYIYFSPEAQVSINTALMFVFTLSTSLSLDGKNGVTGKKFYSYFSITGTSDNL